MFHFVLFLMRLCCIWDASVKKIQIIIWLLNVKWKNNAKLGLLDEFLVKRINEMDTFQLDILKCGRICYNTLLFLSGFVSFWPTVAVRELAIGRVKSS